MTGDEWEQDHRARLVLLSGILLIHDDAHRFLDMVSDADDRADAVDRVSAAYDVDRTTATAMVDTQFGRLTREERRRLTDEAESLRT